jgi:hypothetical protein
MEIRFLIALGLLWLISDVTQFIATVKRKSPIKLHEECGNDRAGLRERAWSPGF